MPGHTCPDTGRARYISVNRALLRQYGYRVPSGRAVRSILLTAFEA